MSTYDGNDTLIGYKDADTLDGGQGIDTCYVDPQDTSVAGCEKIFQLEAT